MTQNYALFPVAEQTQRGYFQVRGNVPLGQFTDGGDSGSPFFSELSDELVGIDSAHTGPADASKRRTFIVDARLERLWILGSALPQTDATQAFDWDGDGQLELARLTRGAQGLALEIVGSAGASTHVELNLASVPGNVQAFGFGRFDSADESLALLADGNLQLVHLSDSSSKTFGHGYSQLLTRRLENDAYTDVVAFRTDREADVFSGSANGFVSRPQSNAVFMHLDPDSVLDAVTVDRQLVQVASSTTELPFTSTTLTFAQPERAQLVPGAFRAFTSPGDQGIQDLAIAEGGEVVYMKASGSSGFGNWSWLYRPTPGNDAKATELNVVEYNDDGYDDLAVTLSDGSLKVFLGGAPGGLSPTLVKSSPLLTADITRDACVDLEDWSVFEDSFGVPSRFRRQRAHGLQRRRPRG